MNGCVYVRMHMSMSMYVGMQAMCISGYAWYLEIRGDEERI
jgi:hypothetical protein